MTITTRKPNCKAAWPLVLLAGMPGAGKTWAAVEATSMKQVDRAFFIELGEGVADEYGLIPGADFEIVEHDGTVGNIREAIEWATAQTPAEGKFNMIIFDSLSELWDLLSDNAQIEANKRATRKGRNVSPDGSPIGPDLWRRATNVWESIIAQLHRFPGPVVATARMEMVTMFDDSGQPTKHKEWKIQAQKRLPFRANAVIEARQPRVWTMTKIATTVPELQLEPGQEMTFKEFSLARLFEKMGVAADTAPSSFQEASRDDSLTDEALERAEQEAKARAEEQQRQYAQQRREEDLRDFAASLEALEKAEDVEKVRAGVSYYARHDEQKHGMAAGVLARMEKQAQATVQQELGAEVVEGEVVTTS